MNTATGFLGLKETIKYLNVDKPELERLVKLRRLTAYKLGGAHLRFRKDQLLIVKHELETSSQSSSLISAQKIGQFWSFNSFYIVTGALLSGLLFYFLKA